jgi:hypothetical protein
MNFGGSGIVEECFDWIRGHLPEGKTIFELGSGPVSTQYLSKFYEMISVEDKDKYLNVFKSTYVHAPLVDGWYDLDVVKVALKQHRYDLLLIDGPVSTEGRGGFLRHVSLFNLSVPVIVDDIERPFEKRIVAEIADRTGRKPEWFEQFAVI